VTTKADSSGNTSLRLTVGVGFPSEKLLRTPKELSLTVHWQSGARRAGSESMSNAERVGEERKR